MRNVKSGVRIVNAKQKCPLFSKAKYSLFAVRAFLFFEKKNLLPNCGVVVERRASVGSRWSTRGGTPGRWPLGRARCPRAVHTPRRAFFLGHPSSDVFWDTHRCRDTDTHRCWDTHHRNKDTATRTPIPRLAIDPGGRGFVLIATLWTLAAMAPCPCGRPVLAVGLGRWLSLRPLYDGCPCGRLSLRPTSTASCPPTSSAPLSRRPRLNGSSRGAARGHAGLPVRRLCGHGARDAILGRSQRCGSARVLESRDGQDHSHGRYPLALPG